MIYQNKSNETAMLKKQIMDFRLKERKKKNNKKQYFAKDEENLFKNERMKIHHDMAIGEKNNFEVQRKRMTKECPRCFFNCS